MNEHTHNLEPSAVADGSSGEEATVETLAAEAASWFEVAYRAEAREDRYTRCKDGTPEWVTDLVYEAHGDMFPDDWRYRCISAALEHIAETGDDDGHEFADGFTDVYTGARLAWLASHLSRPGYVEDASAEFGSDLTDLVGAIGMGQYMEALEVYGLVWSALKERADA